MKNSKRTVTSEFLFWFTSLFALSAMSLYVLNLRLEDLGTSSVYVPPFKKENQSRAQVVEEISSYSPPAFVEVKKVEAKQEKKVILESLDEDELEELFVNALQQIDAGDWQSGEKSLLKIIAQDSENVEALRELAMLNLLDKKNPTLATKYFEKSFYLDPNDTGVMNELLQLYEESGSIKDGISFLKSIPEDKKTTPAVDYGIATALSSNGRVEEAVAFYQKAIESSDDVDFSLTEDLADAYGQLGRPQDALDIYNNLSTQITEENDKDRLKTIQVKIVASLIDSGDIEAAKEAANELQKSYPDDDWISTLFDSKSINF